MSAKDLPENFLPGPPKEAAKKTVVNWNPGCVIPQDSRRRRRRRRWFAAARAKKRAGAHTRTLGGRQQHAAAEMNEKEGGVCARAERELFNWGHLWCWEGGEGEEGVRGARRRRATASKRAREWAAEQKRERERASDIQGRIPTAAALKPLQRAKALDGPCECVLRKPYLDLFIIGNGGSAGARRRRHGGQKCRR